MKYGLTTLMAIAACSLVLTGCHQASDQQTSSTKDSSSSATSETSSMPLSTTTTTAQSTPVDSSTPTQQTTRTIQFTNATGVSFVCFSGNLQLQPVSTSQHRLILPGQGSHLQTVYQMQVPVNQSWTCRPKDSSRAFSYNLHIEPAHSIISVEIQPGSTV